MKERTFDWAPHHDHRSRNFPLMAAITPVRLHNKSWKVPTALDQGREGACVGFAWLGEALTTPVKVALAFVRALLPLGLAGSPSNVVAQWIYKQAQQIDEWAGESYSGTSVLAGAKVMQKLGLIKEYRWCFSVQEVVQALLTSGPVVLGINWYSGMYEAPQGILSVSGQHVGGHAIVARAYAVKGEVFEDEAAIGLLNSWGSDWGIDGCAWIRESQLQRLMSERGEACVPFKRSYGR